jgi:DNA-binding transcriptional MerR regulator
MTAGLNIAALAQRTGVPPDTLRKWEQRYRILQPDRTAGGQRRYSERDVARVEWLRERLDEGYRIG